MKIQAFLEELSSSNTDIVAIVALQERFLNETLGAIVELSQEDFGALRTAIDERVKTQPAEWNLWKDFIADMQQKVLKHIENESLYLGQADETPLVEFLNTSIQLVTALYNLSNPSYRNQQALENNIQTNKFNVMALLGLVKHLAPTAQQEILVNFWNNLVLPSQDIDERSQPSALMQKFFEFSIVLSFEVFDYVLKNCVDIEKHMSRQRYVDNTSEKTSFAQENQQRLYVSIKEASINAGTFDAFVRHLQRLKEDKIPFSYVSADDIVLLFEHMRTLDKKENLNKSINSITDRILPAFLYNDTDQDKKNLYRYVLVNNELTESAWICTSLSFFDLKIFFSTLANMNNDKLAAKVIDKVKTQPCFNYNEQLERVKEITVLKGQHSQKQYFENFQQEQLNQLTGLTPCHTETQKDFIDNINKLGEVASLFSDGNLIKLFNSYWRCASDKQESSPLEQYLPCFTVFHERIKNSPLLKQAMLLSVLAFASEKDIVENKEIAWFCALVASGLDSDNMSTIESIITKLSKLRHDSKEKKEGLFASIFAYVEMFYQQSAKSVLHEVNFRPATKNSWKTVSQTGVDLTNYPNKPTQLISADDANAQLFKFPSEKEDEITGFWFELSRPAAISSLTSGVYQLAKRDADTIGESAIMICKIK